MKMNFPRRNLCQSAGTLPVCLALGAVKDRLRSAHFQAAGAGVGPGLRVVQSLGKGAGQGELALVDRLDPVDEQAFVLAQGGVGHHAVLPALHVHQVHRLPLDSGFLQHGHGLAHVRLVGIARGFVQVPG